MNTYNRFNDQIPISRLLSGVARRINNIPHSVAWNLSSKNKNKLLKFRNIHVGERCFIIGNGPSLNVMNLDLLKSEFSFGLNRIYMLFDKFEFRPTYFVSINDLVLKQFSTEIAILGMPKFINWNLRNIYDANDRSLIFIKTAFGLQDKFREDITKPISSGGTVTFVAMQIAYWMGFKEVVLVGVDHNFVDKGTPNKTEIRNSDADLNHFHPNYFPKGSKWQLPDLLRSEISFSLAKEAFEMDNRRVLDATEGGKLNIFEKVKFKDVIASRQHDWDTY